MRNVWILLLCLTLSTFFMHVPHKGQIGFLFNPDVKLSYNQYVWFFCQNVVYVFHGLVIWNESKAWQDRTREERKMLTRIYSGYVWILVADGFMWILSYNDPLKDYIITWNILKTLLFVGVIVYERQFRSKDY